MNFSFISYVCRLTLVNTTQTRVEEVEEIRKTFMFSKHWTSFTPTGIGMD